MDAVEVEYGPPVRFVRAGPRSRKVACTVCGRQGYDYGSWKQTCLRGHRECLNGCGKLMGVLINGNPRRHPSHRCPATSPDIIKDRSLPGYVR